VIRNEFDFGFVGHRFLSKFAVATELKAKTLVAVRVTGLNIKRELKIVYRKDKHLGNAARIFIEMAKGSV
jgi:DNA-binding transcriptional LysR family regulator